MKALGSYEDTALNDPEYWKGETEKKTPCR
jgi:hypothetical protein